MPQLKIRWGTCVDISGEKVRFKDEDGEFVDASLYKMMANDGIPAEKVFR